MAKYEFNGLTTETLTELDKEAFKEIYETVFVKTIPFTVELENKTVELHTFIEDIDLAEIDDEDTTDHVITIGIIPSFNSLFTASSPFSPSSILPPGNSYLCATYA